MNFAEQLPALQIVLPLASAPLAMLLRDRLAAFVLVLAASWAAFAISVLLWLQVGESGIISYALGSWPAPWGIEYRVDALSSLVLMLVAGIAAVVLPYSRASIEREIRQDKHHLFYALFALCLTGLLGITITGDAFNLFVFLEISSLSSYALIALGKDRRSLVASYQYLIMGTIGATFIVIGVGLLYLMTGTLNLADIGVRLQAMCSHAAGAGGAGLPHRRHLAEAGLVSAAPVAAQRLRLRAVGSVGLPRCHCHQGFGLRAAALLLLGVRGNRRLPAPADAGPDAATGAGRHVRRLDGSDFPDNLKRLFAYSSVAQVGYIVLGISFDSVTGLTATIVHLVNHAVTKGGLFLLLGAVVAGMGGVTLARVHGIGRVMPLTSFGIVLCGLSLIGVPGTAGFVSKWYLILAALEKGQWWLVFLIALSSLAGGRLRVAFRRSGLLPSAALRLVQASEASLDHGNSRRGSWWRQPSGSASIRRSRSAPPPGRPSMLLGGTR
jgi:multicomponent Na+:H+ antiporter subunit D